MAMLALLVLATSTAATAPRSRTFGRGIPNHPFTDTETEIYNHTLAAGSTSGMVTHFWSTACGAGVSFKAGIDSGRTTYRYYIDGETTASVVFTPREAAGVIFDPVGECNDPSCTHPAPGGDTPRPRGGPGNDSRHDEYKIGGRGQTCDEACAADGHQCNPSLNPNGTTATDLGEMMAGLVEFDTGAKCKITQQLWWAHDQPSYVWAANNSNYGKCLGTRDVPAQTWCNGSHPLVRRLCRCVGGNDDAPAAGAAAAELSGSSWARDKAALMAAHPAVTFPGPTGLDTVSAKVPWGTEWLGKTSDMDGYCE